MRIFYDNFSYLSFVENYLFYNAEIIILFEEFKVPVFFSKLKTLSTKP